MVLFPLLIASSGLCQDNLDWPPCQTLCQSSNIYDCPQWQVTRREGGYLEEWDHLNIAFIFSVTSGRILLCLLSTCSCKVYPRLDHLNPHCQIILEIQILMLRKKMTSKIHCWVCNYWTSMDSTSSTTHLNDKLHIVVNLLHNCPSIHYPLKFWCNM